MKTKEKKLIGILVIIIIIAVIALIIIKTRKKEEDITTNNQIEEEFVDVLEDGTKLNKSDKLHETKKFDGLKITNFQLTQKDNVTVLLGTITNETQQTKGGYPVKIKIVDKNENEIITVGGFIGELKPGESMQLNSSATFDYANAYDFEITKK